MNKEQFITLLKQPENIQRDIVVDLKEIIELYPYFVQPKLLMVKAMKLFNNIHFERNLRIASAHSFNRRGFYYYIYPEKKLSVEHYHRENAGKSSGDYFDMIETVERTGGDSKQSLKLLAERLKAARIVVLNPKNSENDLAKELAKGVVQNDAKSDKIDKKPISLKIEPELTTEFQPEISENYAKKCIQGKKYSEAIEILKKLNLNNPKKSVYFADQIRFLEKVISNSKK